MSISDRNAVLDRLVMERCSSDTATVINALYSAVMAHPTSPGALRVSSAFVDMLAKSVMSINTLKKNAILVKDIVDHSIKFVNPHSFVNGDHL